MSLRRDGRKTSDLRPLALSFDGLARVDGSARFAFGPTAALASLSGPIQVRPQAEHPSQATFEVTVLPLAHVPAPDAKARAAALRGLLAPALLLAHTPRTLVQLVAQALARDAGAADAGIAALVNASMLALLSAGSVPLRGVVCAVAVGQRAADAMLLVDPAEEELAGLRAGGCFAFLFADSTPTGAECVWSDWHAVDGASFDDETVLRAREAAQTAAVKVRDAMKDSVRALNGLEPHTEGPKAGNERKALDVDDSDDDKMEI